MAERVLPVSDLGSVPDGRPGGPADRAAVALARRLSARVHDGTLLFEGAGGGWKAGNGDPLIRITVHDPRAYRAVLGRWSKGLADSFIAGWWDTDDLTGLISVLLANMTGPLDALDRLGRAASGPLSAWRRVRPPTQSADRHNVQAHYDLPGELFEAMLDESMTYSCAVFDHPDATLAEAQAAKLERICTKLDLGPDDEVVEIGTGWGGFALHAASSRGCRVTTTTVSDAQREVATRRVAEAGLSDRVTVLGVDYRELEGRFDKLVSVEMIEAVDWRRHGAFFAACRDLLRPDGLMLLQAIVMADRSYERAKHHDDFIRSLVFPGGCLPSITVLSESATRATDLRIVDLEDIGRHYAATLRCWHSNFDEAWDAVAPAGFDDRFRRMWNLYLCYCEAAFLERHISDVQVVYAGPDWRPGLATRMM